MIIELRLLTIEEKNRFGQIQIELENNQSTGEERYNLRLLQATFIASWFNKKDYPETVIVDVFRTVNNTDNNDDSTIIVLRDVRRVVSIQKMRGDENDQLEINISYVSKSPDLLDKNINEYIQIATAAEAALLAFSRSFSISEGDLNSMHDGSSTPDSLFFNIATESLGNQFFYKPGIYNPKHN